MHLEIVKIMLYKGKNQQKGDRCSMTEKIIKNTTLIYVEAESSSIHSDILTSMIY